jgi:hypothetical protein
MVEITKFIDIFKKSFKSVFNKIDLKVITTKIQYIL